jgi:hypothetical protein
MRVRLDFNDRLLVSRPLDDPDLVVGQAVQVVHEPVDLLRSGRGLFIPVVSLLGRISLLCHNLCCVILFQIELGI